MAIDSYGFFTGLDYFIGWMSGSRKWRISYRYPVLQRPLREGFGDCPEISFRVRIENLASVPKVYNAHNLGVVSRHKLSRVVFVIASLAFSIADRVTFTCLCSRCPSSLPTMPTYEKQEFADFEAFELAMQDWALQGEMKLTYNTAVCVRDVVHFPNEEHTGNCLGAAPIHRGRSSRPSWLQRAPFRSQRRQPPSR